MIATYRAEQVDPALEQKFITEEERLLFWHDADGEFSEYVKGQLTCYAEA